MMNFMYIVGGALLVCSASVAGMRGHTIALPAHAPDKQANGLAAYNRALERWGGEPGAAEVLSRRSALQGRGDKRMGPLSSSPLSSSSLLRMKLT